MFCSLYLCKPIEPKKIDLPVFGSPVVLPPLLIGGDYTSYRVRETWHNVAPGIYKLWKAVENDDERIAFGA